MTLVGAWAVTAAVSRSVLVAEPSTKAAVMTLSSVGPGMTAVMTRVRVSVGGEAPRTVDQHHRHH